jgi:DNA-binding response OmpR family regulator
MALILFIDDNLDTLALLEHAARIVGHAPISSMSPEEGLNLASTHKPDLIFIDFNLPSLTADQLVMRIRQSDDLANIPIIILSASLTAEQACHALKAGANRCMQKPLSLDELTIAIRSTLQL